MCRNHKFFGGTIPYFFSLKMVRFWRALSLLLTFLTKLRQKCGQSVKNVGRAFVRILPFSPSFVQKLITNHYHYKSPSSKMWAGRQKCGQKSFWWLTDPTKTAHFGAKKIWNGSPKKIVAPAHVLNVIFAKKLGPDWSTLASGGVSIKFRRI